MSPTDLVSTRLIHKAASNVDDVLNHDFCPWANKYVYWLKKPMGILIVAAIAAFLCGLFVTPQGLVISAAIMATLALGIVWPWIGLLGLSCELRFPHDWQ